jgi:hypothetical protein
MSRPPVLDKYHDTQPNRAARMRKTGYSFSIDFMDYFAANFDAAGIGVSQGF